MRITFYVILRLRKVQGFEADGSFNFGNDRASANRIFSELKGQDHRGETDMLHIDLMETTNGLPLNLRVMSCKAEEIAENVKCVSFKLFNLEKP